MPSTIADLFNANLLIPSLWPSAEVVFDAKTTRRVLCARSLRLGNNMGGVSVWHLLIVLIFFGLPIVLKLCGIGAKRVMMKNKATGQIKSGFYGFSWTYLFFGFWVPLFRGELGVAALHLFFTIITAGLWQLVVSFLYNKQYSNRLIEKGFRFSDTLAINQRAAERIGVDLDIHATA